MGATGDHGTGVGLEHWGAEFPTTHWSVLAGGGKDSRSNTERFVAEMATSYWYPLYVYLRRSGQSPHDAQDLTQGFFAHLLTGERLKGADAEKGRFRSYLLGAMNHYLANVRERASAKKRGGGQIPLSIEHEMAEERFHNEPVNNITPEDSFDCQWALAVFEQAMNELRQEFDQKGKLKVFEELKGYLSGEGQRAGYGRAAERLQTTEVNVRTMVKRLRVRYRGALKKRIELTLASSDDLDDELRLLFAAATKR